MVGEEDPFSGLKGKRFEFSAVEKRCLELSLAPVLRLRHEAARLEIRALTEARAFLVERLGLPASCQVKIVREEGVPVGVEVASVHRQAPAAQASSAETLASQASETEAERKA